MVAVTHAAPQAAAPQAVQAWLDSLAAIYTDSDRERFRAAYEFARSALGEARNQDGEPMLARALGTASIVAAQRLDPDSIASALLIGLPGQPAYDEKEVVSRFGDDVATLIGGVARMNSVHALASGTDEQRAVQAENLRKMLLAMVDDIRVVLIKLADGWYEIVDG